MSRDRWIVRIRGGSRKGMSRDRRIVRISGGVETE